MNKFTERLRQHVEHVTHVGGHCSTEETTKQALILPFLEILGFNPYDPTKVQAEYSADFPGAKARERVDYALFCQQVPVMFVEAKSYEENLDNHCPQLSRYFNATHEVTVAAITNGREWRFFTDLVNKNVMDAEPFLTVDFTSLDESLISRLYQFRHDEFQPDALRTLAEESVYANAFKDAVKSSVLECDSDFVRFLVNKSTVQRTLTTKFLETVTPIVKQAVAQALSEMVANSLSAPLIQVPAALAQQEIPNREKLDIVDPVNPKIITTPDERRILKIVSEVLGVDADVSGKDTETYYAVIYNGKATRWLIRYYAEGKNPRIQICVPLTEERRKEIERAGLQIGGNGAISLPRPDYLQRIPGIIFDTHGYCSDDNNFKRPVTLAGDIKLEPELKEFFAGKKILP